jgi:hypothetical protein
MFRCWAFVTVYFFFSLVYSGGEFHMVSPSPRPHYRVTSDSVYITVSDIEVFFSIR